MASPLTVRRNDYHKNPKSSAIYTPPGIAKFLFDILHKAWPLFPQPGGHCGANISATEVRPVITRRCTCCRPAFLAVLDPAIGSGQLTDPWFKGGYRISGCDIVKTDGVEVHNFHRGPFEKIEAMEHPDLVLCNPPFNGAPGKRLYPEVFLAHVFKLFGPTTPVVMFMPMGFRLNQRRKSTRWRWLRDGEAKITSIISLPLDTFPGVEFHAEILVFNVAGIQPHYFLPEEAVQ